MRDLSAYRVPGAAALKRAELSILLTGDSEIRILNRDWRGKNKATDVLSFPQVSAKELRALARVARVGEKVPAWWLGDIVISLERANAQANEHGHSLREELLLLLAHGLLHLLGFDHEKSDAEATKMRGFEKRLIGRTMIH